MRLNRRQFTQALGAGLAAARLAGILAAKQLPSAGGDTLWSSNLAAYDAYLSGKLEAYELPDEEIRRALKAIEGLPKP